MTARIFTLVRDVDATGISGTGTVAEGVEFTDGVVALRWLVPAGNPGHGNPTSVVFHDNGLASVEKIHGHSGATRIVFADPENPEPVDVTDLTHLREQIDRLATFIADEVPGEPSRSEGAVDVAIRLLRDRVENTAAPDGQPAKELSPDDAARAARLSWFENFAAKVVGCPEPGAALLGRSWRLVEEIPDDATRLVVDSGHRESGPEQDFEVSLVVHLRGYGRPKDHYQTARNVARILSIAYDDRVSVSWHTGPHEGALIPAPER